MCWAWGRGWWGCVDCVKKVRVGKQRPGYKRLISQAKEFDLEGK